MSMTGHRTMLYSALLLLPATVLLWVFTYQPIFTTILNSFYSTPRGAGRRCSWGSRITRR